MDRHHDVFLSYNSADSDTVHRVAEHLRRDGLEPWLDKWALTPGRSWQDEIVEGLSASSTCAVMVGPAGLGDWAREELAVAHDRAAKDPAFRLFLVLLPGAPEITDPRLSFLRTRTWVDLRAGIADPDAFQDLVSAITGAARVATIGDGDGDGVDAAASPYRGLARFEEDQAEFFFGREDDTSRILEMLKGSRFAAIMGASGSGKSSLVRAGVVRALRAGRLPGSDDWVVRVFTPGARPLAALAAQIHRAFPQESMQGTLAQLRDDERSLDLAATVGFTDAPADRRLVLVADQFEELFTLCDDEVERHAFLDNLLYAATIPGGRVVVLVGMRADFYHRCAPYPDLRSLITAQQYLVGPLTVEGLRRAIEEPARRVGVGLEAGLLDTILADVGAHPGGLPLLQHVLYELWQRRRGRMLTLEAYVAAGRLEGALAKRANAVYEALPADQQAIARRALLRLVQPGEGTEDTRRQASFDELVSHAADRDGVEAVVEALAQERMVVFGHDDASGHRVVEITHEALIRGWPELRAWIDEQRDTLRSERRLTEAAQEWERGGRDESLLYRGARLSAWDDRDVTGLSEGERAFLAASRSRSARQAQVRRAITASLSVLTVLALLAASVALVNLRRAGRETDRAEIATRLATSRRMAAESVTALGRNDQSLAALLALGGDRLAHTVEASSALASALAADIDPSTVLAGHTADVRSLAVAADGTIVTGGLDAGVLVWPPAGGPPSTLRGHDGEILDVAVDSDGRQAYSAGIDGTVRTWDLRAGGAPVVRTVEAAAAAPAGPAGGGGGGGGGGGRAVTPAAPTPGAPAAPVVIRAVAVQPGGDLLAGAGADGTVRLWPRNGSSAPRTVATGEPDLRDVAWRPDGGAFATSSRLGRVQIWDTARGEQLTSFKGSDDAVFGLAWSADGLTLAAAGRDRTLRLWDVAAGRSRDIVAHDGEVFGVAYSAAGDRVATASADRRVRVWDPRTGQQVSQLVGHSSDVRAVAFGADRSIVSASSDTTVRRWNVAGTGTARILAGATDAVLDVAVTPDGGLVAGAVRDGTVATWSLPDGAPGRTLTGHVGAVFAVAALPGPRPGRVASAGFDGTVRVWDLATGTAEVLRGHEGAVRSITAGPDGQLVTGGADGTVRVWAPGRTVSPSSTYKVHERDVLAVALHSSKPLMASGGADGTVRVWDGPRNDPAIVDSTANEVRALAWSPDGETLAVAGADGRIRRYGAPDWTAGGPILDHGAEIRDVAYSADGRVLASAGRDLVVRLWAGDEALAALAPHASDVRAVAFVPGDELVVSASNDGRVKAWPAPAAWAAAACRLAGRDLRPEEWDRFAAGVDGARPALC